MAGFLNIYFMRYSLVADHSSISAMIGIAALAAGVLAGQAERRGAFAKVGIAAAAALVAVLAAATWIQSLIYRDAETLWRDTVRKNAAAWMAWNNLAACVTASERQPISSPRTPRSCSRKPSDTAKKPSR